MPPKHEKLGFPEVKLTIRKNSSSGKKFKNAIKSYPSPSLK